MKYFIRFCLLTGLFSMLMTQGIFNVSAAPTPKTVLVLSPFQLDLSTNLIAGQALREEFAQAADLSLDVYYEYLDLNRFPDPAYQQDVFDLLKTKYKNKPVDLVVISSESMLKIWMAQRAEILPATPVVFFDVFTEHLAALNLPADITGVSGVENCETTVRWVISALPAVNEIVLVNGVGKIEQGFFDHIQKLQQDLAGQVKFTDLSGLSLAEIKERVHSLPKTAVIFYHPMFADAQGNAYRPLDVLRELSAVSSVPVLGGYDQFIGAGIIGGFMYSIDQQAHDAAKLGLRLLHGEALSSLPIAQNVSNRFIFDHLTLQRFGIPLSLLPPDSLIKNRQYSFWELYQPQIIATGMGIAILLLLVVFLLALTQKLNRTRLSLAELNRSLEKQVQDRTNSLHQANSQLLEEIRDRKQADEQLGENQRRLTTLLSNLPGMAYRCRNDQDWTMDFISEGCQDLTGYAAEDLIENRILSYGQLIHPSDQAQVWDNVQTALQTHTAYDMVYRVLTRTGGEKWVMERGMGVFTSQGELLALEGFISDISQLKRTEEKLSESEEKFRSLLDSQESNIMMIDFEGVHHYVNQVGAVSMTGSGNAQDVVGKRLYDIFPAQMADWQLEQIHQVFASGEGFAGDVECCIDNQSSWWHLNLQPIRTTSGQVAQVMVNSIEITERKHAEQALKASELFVSGVLNSLTAQIAVLDERGVILTVNDAWKKFATGNDCPDPNCYVGTNYLTVCENALNAGDQSVIPMLEGMRAVLSGAQTQYLDEYPCDAPGKPRWFTVTVLPQSLPHKGLIVVHQDISERKLAEQALKKSETSLQTVLQSTADGILAVDSENKVLLVNERFVEMWQIPADVLASRDDTLLLRHSLEQLTNSDGYLDKVQELYHSDQESFDILNFKDGRVYERLSRPMIRERHSSGRVWSFRDVTARSRAETDLRESEARTATILRLSPIVIGVSTVTEGRYTDINDAFEQVLGYTPAETIGHTSYELNLWVGDETRANILREIQTHGRVENLEIQLRRKSGEIFSALIFITPIVLHDINCLLTMVMDITERKRSEEQLRETRDALQTIIFSSPLAIVALDPEDRVTMWNPAAEDMFGWSDKQILGQINPIVPEHKIKEYEALRKATLNGMSFSNMDTVRMKKNGTQIPVSLSVAPLRGKQSQVIGRLHIITDITERKKMQEELRQQATTDELTKVSNRRYFMELAQKEIKRAVRPNRPSAIALIDIDHFKQINDTYGHAAGDQALIGFAKICQKQIREIDVFARFGGDEFVLFLSETNQEQAYEVLERIRLALPAQPIQLDEKSVTLSISSGVASISGDQESIDTLLSHADQALYRAKESGRNRVVRFDSLGICEAVPGDPS